MKKRVLALVLSVVMAAASLVGCSTTGNDSAAEYKVAMVTDYGDITDQSFNQTTYEACKAFCEEQDIEFTYKKPANDSTEARVASTEEAIDEGYNVIVMPGYAFAGTIVEVAEANPDVKFIVLDCGEGDYLAAVGGDDYYANPDNYSLDQVYLDNVYTAIYQEELSGYMAGYAAVMLGYTELGFLGGMAVPAVIRYGYGFVQGANDAAAALGETVNIKYVYGGQFYGDADITAVMDAWYTDGTEVVFACGGGIYTSAVDAAVKVDGKVIGVDVDQAGVITDYSGDSSMTVTSAMKGLYPTTYDALTDIIVNGKWSDYANKIVTLGLVSGTDPEANYVQIPMDSTQWADSFTQDDYKAMVADMYNGTITVSNDTTTEPTTPNANVDYLGSIK